MPARTRCTKCIYHGDNSYQDRNHKRTCPYLACGCRKCVLLNERKVITDKLLRRPQPVKVADSNISRYTCSKCRRHGLIVSKKFHEPCPYIMCKCEICKITIRKKQIDRELDYISRTEKKDRDNRGNTRLLRSILSAPTERAPSIVNGIIHSTHILSNQQVFSNQDVHQLGTHGEKYQDIQHRELTVLDHQVLSVNSEKAIQEYIPPEEQISSSANSVDISVHSIPPVCSQGFNDQLDNTVNSIPHIVQAGEPLLPEAQIMIDLISALATSNDFSAIDYEAIKNFLATPSFDVPSTWSPHFPAMIDLVHMALRKLPYFHNLEFERVVD